MRSTGQGLGSQLEALRTASVALRRRRSGAVGSGAVPMRMTSRLSRWARAVNRSSARRRSSQLRLRVEYRPGERENNQRGEQEP
jgi:hypothetical protein